jgi:long-chain acyl-CoA synthetase
MNEMRLAHFAARDPEAPAITDPQGRTWSRGEVAGMANRMARALRAAGLAPGDSLAILAPNCVEYLTTYVAATQIGLYVVPINWHLAPGEILYILKDCEARALVTHERFASLTRDVLASLEHCPEVRVSIGPQDGFVALDDFVANISAEPLTDSVMGRSLFYTSATTGRPKGVMLPLDEATRALDLSIERRVDVDALGGHVQLIASMLYHGAPLETAVTALHMGNAVVLTDTTSPEGILRLIEKYRVTSAFMVPTLFSRLLNLDERTRSQYSLASLRRVVHGGAPCPVDVKRRMIEWLGPVLWEAYGATEGAGTVVGSQDWLKYPGTVGKAIPGSRLKILGEAGEELPPGCIGTIYMTRFTGDRFYYRGDPEKTRAAYSGEFFTVGDVGYLNEEGFLFICDRKIDMIILSGMKVYSAEIENVLARHPQVADSAVFGVPDEISGEAIVALIQPTSTTCESRELRSEILRFLRQHLALGKLPRSIFFTAQLPREPTGKVQKRRLREQYSQKPSQQAAR